MSLACTDENPWKDDDLGKLFFGHPYPVCGMDPGFSNLAMAWGDMVFQEKGVELWLDPDKCCITSLSDAFSSPEMGYAEKVGLALKVNHFFTNLSRNISHRDWNRVRVCIEDNFISSRSPVGPRLGGLVQSLVDYIVFRLGNDMVFLTKPHIALHAMLPHKKATKAEHVQFVRSFIQEEEAKDPSLNSLLNIHHMADAVIQIMYFVHKHYRVPVHKIYLRRFEASAQPGKAAEEGDEGYPDIHLRRLEDDAQLAQHGQPDDDDDEAEVEVVELLDDDDE